MGMSVYSAESHGMEIRGYYKEGKSKNTVCRLNETGKLIRQAFLWKLDGCANGDILDKLEARGSLTSYAGMGTDTGGSRGSNL